MALVTLRSYRDPIDAELAKTKLESAGIPAIVADQHLVSLYWLYSLAIGGVRVQVEQSDLATAREVLREDHSADLVDIPESQPPLADGDLCPVCGSPEVGMEIPRLLRSIAVASLALGLPPVVWRRRWICRACHHAWKRRPSGVVEASPETLEAELQVHEQRSYFRAIFAAIAGVAILYYVWLQIHS